MEAIVALEIAALLAAALVDVVTEEMAEEVSQ